MTEDDRILRADCVRILSGNHPLAPDAWLRALAERPEAALPADLYGAGGAVEALEARTAGLLGKEKGLFVIKGVIAQLAVLKSVAERAGSTKVAIHPLSHIALEEGDAISLVGGLAPLRIGRFAPFGVRELEAVTDPLAAIVVELPLRRAGYLLPPLDELRAISALCRARSIHLHFDGARIWEAAAGYDVPLAELAGLADSLYVSFYKGLGAPGGALVAGDAAFLATLAAWKGRFGGNLFTVFPYALGGLAGLDTHLPRMKDYVARVRSLAAALDGLVVNPTVPHVNSFQLLLSGTPAALTGRNRRFAEEKGVWLFNAFGDSPLHGHSTAEVVIGDTCDGWTIDEAAAWIKAFITGDDASPPSQKTPAPVPGDGS